MTKPPLRGRPPLPEAQRKSNPVNVALDARTFDRACRVASRHGVSMATVLRRGLARLLRDDDPQNPDR